MNPILLFPGTRVSPKVPRLADVISAGGILDTLVDSRQPSWFLHGVLRALVLFTSSELNVHPFLACVFGGCDFFDNPSHSCRILRERVV